MTLMELQKILGERIRIVSNTEMSMDERKKEAELSQTISSLAKQMINNADVVSAPKSWSLKESWRTPISRS